MAPKRSEGATEGLRVINYVVPCVLKSNFLEDPYIYSSCTFAAACKKLTMRKCSSN